MCGHLLFPFALGMLVFLDKLDALAFRLSLFLIIQVPRKYPLLYHKYSFF